MPDLFDPARFGELALAKRLVQEETPWILSPRLLSAVSSSRL
jgi:hypothetical protein